MSEEMNIMLTVTAQLNKDEAKDVFIPVRTSEYRELVELATTYKMKYEEVTSRYWEAHGKINELEEQIKGIKEATK